MLTATIDFDFENFKNPELAYLFLLYRLKYISRGKNLKQIRVYRSTKGFHIYVAVDGEYDFWKSFVIRAFLKDDLNRLEIDMRRRKYREVLFKVKFLCKGVYCQKVSEEIRTAELPQSIL